MRSYGNEMPVHQNHICSSNVDCSCLVEDCCFEDGQPPGICGKQHLFQNEEVLVTCISNYVNKRVAANNQLEQLRGLSTIFHAVRPPSISVLDYMLRMFKYAFCSRSCFIISVIYLEKAAAKEQSFRLTSLNVHRLLITSLMLAAKYLDDIYYNNAYYAKVGGVSLSELNLLELELLHVLEFSVAVSKKEYFMVENMLIQEALTCGSACNVLLANNFTMTSHVHVDSSYDDTYNSEDDRAGAMWQPHTKTSDHGYMFQRQYYITERPPPGFEWVCSNVKPTSYVPTRLVPVESSSFGIYVDVSNMSRVSPVTPECVQVGPGYFQHRPIARRF
eukprot:jgi/Galph1/2630/GphlegSOOS_G1280.1